MKLSKEYILNNLAHEDLWTPGSKGTFTYGDWLLTLKREDDLYGPYKFAIEGRKEVLSKALTYETWSRRYVSMEKAFLHILNHFNENANVKDKYDHIDFDVLSSIKDLPSVSFENPTITLDFGNIVSELENKNLRLLHVKDNPALFVVDSMDNLYAIETYYAGGYLDRYIGEKYVISFEQIEHPVRNFEEWRKSYWDAAGVKDFIKGIVQKEYPNFNSDEVQSKEFVITMSSGGGTVRDFLTCSSRKEAEEICESYDWRFVDENAFEWSLDIDEREREVTSLDAQIAEAKGEVGRDADKGIGSIDKGIGSIDKGKDVYR